ncbi:hypothetical protein H0266_13885 [Halobacillus locisalis]|uniref:Uncharacterized protein n=1 Tax=Halobacillus locisalis TaxID=220753 RepID=A0A838CV12_9BACI|nr:hypothetical protein [Halobacillus locisalis]MBA2175982.1 hypothetical protein [Halobacillus locisalis]
MDLFLFISFIVALTFIFLYFVMRYDFKKKALEVEEKKLDLEKRKLELKEEHQDEE